MQAFTAAHWILQKTPGLQLPLAYAHLPTNMGRVFFWFSFFFFLLLFFLSLLYFLSWENIQVRALLVIVQDLPFYLHLFVLYQTFQSVFWRPTTYWGYTCEFVVPKWLHSTFLKRIRCIFSFQAWIRFVREIMLSDFINGECWTCSNWEHQPLLSLWVQWYPFLSLTAVQYLYSDLECGHLGEYSEINLGVSI